MDSTSLSDLAREPLQQARVAHSGRSAHTVHGGRHHGLRQTLVAPVAEAALDEHELPDARHSMEVDENSVLLLTVAERS